MFELYVMVSNGNMFNYYYDTCEEAEKAGKELVKKNTRQGFGAEEVTAYYEIYG